MSKSQLISRQYAYKLGAPTSIEIIMYFQHQIFTLTYLTYDTGHDIYIF